MTALRPESCFHAGFVVDDVEAAMAVFSQTLDLTWRPRIRGVSEVRADGHETEVRVDAVYSVQGPPYLELIARQPGTIWAVTGVHHLGYWAANLERTAAALDAAGVPEVVRFLRDGRVLATYHQGPDGSRIELIAESSRARLFNFE